MPTPDVQKALEDLRDELDSIAAPDSDQPDDIADIRGQIVMTLDNLQDADHHQNLLERLRDSIEHFEAEHPRLIQPINAVIQALVNAGL